MVDISFFIEGAFDNVFKRRSKKTQEAVDSETQPAIMGTNAERILRCLQESSKPLGRAAILDGTGLTPSQYATEIKQLKNKKLVTTHGAGRNTTYSV